MVLLELSLRPTSLSARQDTDLQQPARNKDSTPAPGKGTKTLISASTASGAHLNTQTDTHVHIHTYTHTHPRVGLGQASARAGPAALSLSSAPRASSGPAPRSRGQPPAPSLTGSPFSRPSSARRLHGACAPRPPAPMAGGWRRSGGYRGAPRAAPERTRPRSPPRHPSALRGARGSVCAEADDPTLPPPRGGCGDARGGKEPKGRPRRYLRVDVSHREELDIFEHLLRDFQLFLLRRHGAGRPPARRVCRPPRSARCPPSRTTGPGSPVPSPAVPPNRASKARAAGRTIPLRDAGVVREGWAEPPAPSGSPLQTATSAAAEKPPLLLSGRYLRSSPCLRTEVGMSSRARLPPHTREAMVPPETTEAGSGDTRTRPLASRRGEGGGEGSAAPSGPAPLPLGPRPAASAPPRRAGRYRSPPRLLRFLALF